MVLLPQMVILFLFQLELYFHFSYIAKKNKKAFPTKNVSQKKIKFLKFKKIERNSGQLKHNKSSQNFG